MSKEEIKVKNLDYHKLCEDASWNLEWDYLGWKTEKAFLDASQKEWNQTLFNKLNEISAQIHRSTLISGANVIVVPPDLLLLFEDMDYYNGENKTLGPRYNIKVSDNINSRNVLIYLDPPSGTEVNSKFYGVVRVNNIK